MSWSRAAVKLAGLHKLNEYAVMRKAQRAIDGASATYGVRLFFVLYDGLNSAAFRVRWQPQACAID